MTFFTFLGFLIIVLTYFTPSLWSQPPPPTQLPSPPFILPAPGPPSSRPPSPGGGSGSVGRSPCGGLFWPPNPSVRIVGSNRFTQTYTVQGPSSVFQLPTRELPCLPLRSPYTPLLQVRLLTMCPIFDPAKTDSSDGSSPTRRTISPYVLEIYETNQCQGRPSVTLEQSYVGGPRSPLRDERTGRTIVIGRSIRFRRRFI